MAIELIPYGGWKRNARLFNGELELVVSLDVGPRVLRCGFKGWRNLFGEFPEQLGKAGEKKWMLRGGHRLWVAPETRDRTYELDNGSVQVEEIRNGLRVVAKPGPVTRLRKTLEIRLAADRNRVTIDHTLTNEGRKPAECSAWALSVMAQRGLAILPLPKIARGSGAFAPNQNWSLWSYTDLGDPRLSFGSRFILVRQDPRLGPTKIGMAHRQGWVAYLVNGCLFVKRFKRDDSSVYPDGNVNLEVYTDKRILELETLAPLVTLRPGQSTTHREEWTVFKDVPAYSSVKDIESKILPIL